MKKIIYILFILSLFTSGCASNSEEELAGKIIEVKAPELKTMFESKESFVVYAGKSDCSSCSEFTRIVNQIIDHYDFTIYYLNVDNLNEDEDIKELVYNYFFKMEWTPCCFIVKDGKSVDMNEGVLDYTSLMEWLESYGYLNN